ncbi:C40 family peptidase [Tenacibaculum soleae]|uniref:Hydrolase Nlp/P60 n=1 Tax=Tenacibaculum soleae TaxID=447689 RepID=A0A1B9Y3F2_9FLAO|nr:C40 family peptidase [Tenacibaculum soleae]MDO6745494.1 C40 family peptidase [Tenacibaculum soleae]MDO6813227.1 C40 family peptidase [Tenacibaculum soleae]OCK44344.1 hydrolase Nlp/P60 [Tenacibaculum soleae]
MSFGICNLSIVPLRLEPSDPSEMVNQVVFGEHFEVLKKTKKWSKIRLAFDNYEGFIDNKQYEEITEEIYISLCEEKMSYAGELIDFITDNNHNLTTIPMGARLPFLKDNNININNTRYTYNGKVCGNKLEKSAIIDTAFLFLNVPYLWGGKSPFGIDCSGFTQTVYKLCGYNLLRDAKEQATQGEVLSFIEESEPGDLAFFDNDEGNITHVGIIMNDYNIIHAHGKVRIDKLDHSGIYNIDTLKHTHKLRVIKRYI